MSYLRVSTQKQGAEGLGIEAQRRAVADFMKGGNWQLIGELVEVESGKRRDRPKLAEAIALCRAFNARLVIAKLDRLSRDAAFLLSLRDAGVEFIAADNPHANRLTVGILALVAEQEREAISYRTKAALAAARARGVQLGAFRDGQFVGRIGNAENASKARQARSIKSRQKAENIRFLLDRLDPDGQRSLRGLAESLNQEGIPTPSGRGMWSAQSVKRLRQKLLLV
ncbi:recombinase family protein [Aphanothece microscopica]|uniref:recombinase family protein n=1 Tax=Aphanothece microscopica TaxID=1049561 RepID=UPI0039855CB1